MDTLQSDELETIQSIYGEEFVRKNNPPGGEIKILVDDSPHEITLSFSFPAQYPNQPPSFYLSAPWLTRSLEEKSHLLQEKLLELFSEGQPVIYDWVEFIRTNTAQIYDLQQEESDPEAEADTETNQDDIPILSGEPITDRKSKFQAFIAHVEDCEDVAAVLRQLKSNKKIANATHNMYAYRIVHGQKIQEDRDDDGEGGAGDKMLYLLRAKKVENLMVVVSRWYGGIQLGQTRFKHITDCTIDILEMYRRSTPNQKLEGQDSKSKKKKK